MYRHLLVAFGTLALIACSKEGGSTGTGGGPAPVRSAMDACRRFESAGAASGCNEESVEPALTPGAKQRVVFKLPSGKRGQVFSFDDKDDYEKSAKSIEKLDAAGPHVWGNSKSKIYVQLNKEATSDEAQKLHSVLDSF